MIAWCCCAEVDAKEREGGVREEMWLYNRDGGETWYLVDFEPAESFRLRRTLHASQGKTGSFDRLHWGSTISRRMIRQGIA